MTVSQSFLDLQDRAILVTGASSGIGRATAIAASRQGAKIAVLARNKQKLEETLLLLEGDGHLALQGDVNDANSLTKLFQVARAELGQLHGLVHAAGVHAITPLRSIKPPQVSALLESNVTSALSVTKCFRAPEVRAENASVVLLSSAVGLVGEAGVSVYAASKAAVAALGRSLALELAVENIRVNSIAAGMVETPLTDRIQAKIGTQAWESILSRHPLGLGSSLDVANAALYLLSPVSRWVTGSTLVIDGGYTAQ